MAIDTSIYFQGQQPVQLLNPLDVQSKAQNLRSLAMQNQKSQMDLDQSQEEVANKRKMSDLLRSNTITGADGKTTINKGAALSDMYKFNPEKAMAWQKEFESQDIDTLKRQGEIAKTLAWQVTPENWAQTKAKAIELGMKNADQLPDQYMPEFVNRWQMGTIEGEKQLANRMQQQNFNYGKENDQSDEKYRYADLASRSADRKEARDERRFQSGIVRDEKIQALKTPYGLANTTDDAKKLKEAHESKTSFDNKIDQMIALREKHGGGATMNRVDVERGKQLSKDALLEYKNMAKLGVLSKSDEDIINAIIPEDVLAYNNPVAAIQGQDPILSKLKAFKKDSDTDFQNRIKTRTREGIDGAAQPQTVKMMAPDGSIREVPSNLVGEAIAAGGKKIK